MNEKRRYIRIKPSKAMGVKFSVVPDKKRKRFVKKANTQLTNISGGGMFLELPYLKSDVIESLLSGKNKISLELKVPGYSSTMKILARAVWIDRKESSGRKVCAVGIRFDEINEEDRERLIRYMVDLIIQ